MLDRTRALNQQLIEAKPVIYWMNRDMRVADNWALIQAQTEATRLKQPLAVVFCLQKTFLGATSRHFVFMLEGLKQVARDLAQLKIPMLIIEDDPAQAVPIVADQLGAGLIVSDFSPLRLPRQWRTDMAKQAAARSIAMVEVDAHNIIPVWQVSDKLEFAARTIRPKIHRQLAAWLTEFPILLQQTAVWTVEQQKTLAVYGWPDRAIERYIDTRIERLGGADSRLLSSGPDAGQKRLHTFLHEDLPRYGERNDPNKPVTSRLSAYLHFGQLSAQRVALATQGIEVTSSDIKIAIDDFLEELIVRRELSDNFCFYNPDYDSFAGFPKWAKQTLDAHRHDPRTYRYTDEQLLQGQTHDILWNAAQHELVNQGSMPGYLRMYWAKKLLEWCGSPEQAMQVAIHFNDTYALDGRDPNGYTGIAWSIGGVHDRPWGERAVFGMIRFMSFDGCKRKFSIDDYVRPTKQLEWR
ncbi:MAG: deoxyribodipyrimidine photo-lyase [Eubacteriales bacterium]|nr:deoxyribodipyrimidine photo-lyase [Eubacteriales bacterium]